MTRFITVCAAIGIVLAGVFSHTTVKAQQPQKKSAASKVKVGTFDSRAIAMAYYRSAEFKDELNELRDEFEKAKKAGDEKLVKEFEVKGPAMQKLIHQQGFSTWPVDNILKKIERNLPDIARDAGVELIVSKWDITFQRPGVKFVDVTDLMVDQFDPDEATLKTIREIRKQKPVPLEQLKH